MPQLPALSWLVALVIHQANNLLANDARPLNLLTDRCPVLERWITQRAKRGEIGGPQHTEDRASIPKSIRKREIER